MLSNRIIPILLLKNNGLVKTLKFKDPKYVGDPINAIRIFNEKEVDELILLDIFASREGKEPNYEMIKKISEECFMPLSYGGGIKNLKQAKHIFSLGVEKICLQTASIEDTSFLKELISHYGSQSIVASIDVKKNWIGKYEIFHSSRRNTIKLNWKSFINKMIDIGVGEIVINSVDKDGTLSSPDLNLIKTVCEITNVPVIAAGGVASLEDIKSVINAGASGVGAGAFFVFSGPHKAVLITYPKQSDLKNILT